MMLLDRALVGKEKESFKMIKEIEVEDDKLRNLKKEKEKYG